MVLACVVSIDYEGWENSHNLGSFLKIFLKFFHQLKVDKERILWPKRITRSSTFWGFIIWFSCAEKAKHGYSYPFLILSSWIWIKISQFACSTSSGLSPWPVVWVLLVDRLVSVRNDSLLLRFFSGFRRSLGKIFAWESPLLLPEILPPDPFETRECFE